MYHLKRTDPRDPPDIALTISVSPSASVSFDKTGIYYITCIFTSGVVSFELPFETVSVASSLI